MQPRLLSARISHLAHRKADPADIVATADALRKLSPKAPDDTCNAACGSALAAGLAKNDAADEYATKAAALLREAVKLGLENVAQFDTDTDFDALRQRDDFKKLLADRQAKPE